MLFSKLPVALSINPADEIAVDQTNPLGTPRQTRRAKLSQIFPVAFTINDQFGTNYNAIPADGVNVIIRMRNAGPNTITINKLDTGVYPWNAGIGVGTCLLCYQYNTGITTWAAGAGVTIRNSSSQRARAQYSYMGLICTDVDEWVCVGDFL